MEQFIGCDIHKKFSVFVAVDEKGKASKPVRVAHDREIYRAYLRSLPANSQIAVEAVDEMEEAGHRPHLANPQESKKRMGQPNKHDPLDARGLGILLRNGTLPECWIPPKELREKRELLRTRMAVRDLRTCVKLRIYGALDRYGLHTEGLSDLFGKAGRKYLKCCIAELPEETGRMVLAQVEVIDELEKKLKAIEQRIHEQIEPGQEVKLLMTIPGVGPVLGPVLWLEIGDVNRFPRPEQLASYCGLVPTVHQSGNHVRMGSVSRRVNQYLKWAFVEAATCAVKLKIYRSEHIGHLYARLLKKRGHGRAIVNVARHLAEASYWVLRKEQAYRSPRAASCLRPETGKRETCLAG